MMMMMGYPSLIDVLCVCVCSYVVISCPDALSFSGVTAELVAFSRKRYLTFICCI